MDAYDSKFGLEEIDCSWREELVKDAIHLIPEQNERTLSRIT
jgi:hypothetical protein